MRKRKRRFNINGMILCGLVFFAVGATIFCMVAESREASVKQAEAARIEAEKDKEAAAEAEQEAKRREEFSVRPGVPVGTTEPPEGEKVVYLTFDDGPSENTGKIMDILDKYDAKATFFITGSNESCRPMIKKAYDKGHTIGLHTYSHKYEEVYASEEAYFSDLEKVGKVAEEQIGYVPCFIRFPGGSSNAVSQKYSPGLMTKLTQDVQEKGYQYYDWNIDSGDGTGCGKDEIISRSVTDRYGHVMILLHDSQSKTETVEALPAIMDYYKGQGYEFRAIDRESFVPHHQVVN